METFEKKRAVLLGFLGCILAAVGVIGTMVLFIRKEQVVNTISAGPVKLTITEPEKAGGYDGNLTEGLLPGQALGKVPVIVLEENSEEAYIRVRVDYGGILAESGDETEEERGERLQRIEELEAGIAFSDGWIKGTDGFYYYQKKAAPGSETTLFTQVTIPKSWGNEIAEQTFSIDLTAEAVPADYFDPWTKEKDGTRVILGWYYTDGTPVGAYR